MGEAKRRHAYLWSTNGEDWGLVGFKNSGGRRRARIAGKMLFESARIERDGSKVVVDGTARRQTPRRHELRKVVRRAQGRGR